MKNPSSRLGMRTAKSDSSPETSFQSWKIGLPVTVALALILAVFIGVIFIWFLVDNVKPFVETLFR